MNIMQAKIEVCEGSKKMLNSGLVAGTCGNISVRIDKNYMAITPSGMDYDKLTPEQIVVVNIRNLSYEGNLNPSIELGLHAGIYRVRPEVNAVVHNHSQNACTVAAARKEIPPILDDMVQIIGGSLRCAEYALPGSNDLVNKTLKALGNDRNAVLLANHGAVCAGNSLCQAFVISSIVEKVTRAYIDIQAIGGAAILEEKDIKSMLDFMKNKYGQK